MQASFRVVNADTGQECQVSRIWSREEIIQELKISRRTLDRYIAILCECCGKSFPYRERQEAFSDKHFKAFRHVRELYAQGFLTEGEGQIKDQLVIGGLPK